MKKILLLLGDKLRKPNLQNPTILAGTQNLTNTSQPEEQNQEKSEPAQKEDFLRAPNSQSNDKLNTSDPFDQTTSPTESPPESQIQNMTREAGDGQNDPENTE